ncbi:sulfite exporter TauE/SafE family protein [Aquisphaera insulae]|uniref:sulfite exporter TauE/SafE family protein n=1 Tax=Aquisphaera insulae TaxID=2712864 RepID=UPI0013EAD9C4|nr:sulfite exporter TauE/SafE family protein [Aquisphaera insulae]
MILRWAVLLFCGWLAATVSGAAGFGGALLLLPVLAHVVGGKAAVPILTVAQLLGNLSRAGFGWRDIRWRPALLFSLGAVPASLLGSWLFVSMPSAWVLRAIGVLLLGVVALRHTSVGTREVPERLLAPAGAGVGLVSAVAGSAGPLGAAVFLGLKLGPQAYVASEAVTAVLMHLTKSLAYGRLAALSPGDLLRGLLLGGSLVLGSWTGRTLLARLPERGFSLLVEGLLVVSALSLLLGKG